VTEPVQTDKPTTEGKGMWARASAMARQTPAERNRYVDFLRAFSITAVVLGHWLIAAPHVEGDVIIADHLLELEPWTRALTWFFQVMPLFFLVGGFSNGVSWSATVEKGGTYATWLVTRLQRLINPVMPLFLFWIAFAAFGTALGVSAEMVKVTSQLALVPVWFLAVYLVVVALVPWSWAMWQRFGIGSFWMLFALAVLVDITVFAFGIKPVGYLNFAIVWLAIHQLGYAWFEGRLGNGMRALFLSVAGFLALVMLVGFGPYPASMIGVPGEPVTNSQPPTMALFMLGIFQAGLVLVLEPLGRRALENLRAWTTVVLMNGMIMTVYLWHLTAMVLIVALAYWLGIGLEFEPGSGAWWAWRPVWIGLSILALLPAIALFARFEQGMVPVAESVSRWRLVSSVVLVSGGLALTAAGGIGSEGWTGVRLWVVALPFIGAGLVDFGPLAGRSRTLGGT